MNTRKGFTLVELLVVIAILAILATVSVVGYTAFITGADEQAAITEAEQIKTTLNAGLTIKDYVLVDETYVTEKDGAFVIAEFGEGKAPDKDDVFDATDLEGFGDKLSMEEVEGDEILVYKASNDLYVSIADLEVVELDSAKEE